MNKKVLKRALALSMSLFMAVSSFNVYAEDIASDNDTSEEMSEENYDADTSSDDIGYEDDIDSGYAVDDEVDSQTTTELPADTSVYSDPTMDSLENLEYFLVDQPLLNAPDTENFVASFVDASSLSDFSITVKDFNGNEEVIYSNTVSGNLVKFSKEYIKGQSGEYSVTKLCYVKNECAYYLDLSSMDVKFGVNQEYDGYDELVSLDSLDEESSLEGVVQVTSLEDAESEVASGIAGDSAAMSISDFENEISAQSNDVVTICLDPGHGGNDSGAIGNGVYEKDLNLKIASYCKEELEKYNCNVVMTRTTDTRLSNDSSEDLEKRAEYAKSQGASYLISIHINSSTSNTNYGAEVYYPNDHWRADLGSNGKAVAQAIQTQLTSLGLYNRGIKTRTIDTNQYPDAYRYADGSVADYYGIIRNAKYNGMTGLIIEHCFINNSSDYQNFLSSDAKLRQLGVADANGIVSALGLTLKMAIPTDTQSIYYQTHIQDIGWQSWKINKATSGTEGQSKRLEGIRLQLSSDLSGTISYKTHVQDYGWQDWKSNGEMAGTSGESKRLEAIQIKLSGDVANTYDVYYRVHAQDYGWLDWAKNGESAGTEGKSKRLEAIQVVLVKKGSSAPGSTSKPFVYDMVSYRTHVQDYGWQSYVSDGTGSGTSGKSKRLEAINIKISSSISGGISYRTHVQDIGWQDWKSNNQLSGTSGQSKRLEAIQIKLTGDAENIYDVYYRVHAQDYGWLDWAKNGESAGTEGLSKRLEMIEVRLVKKGSSAPGSTSRPFIIPYVEYRTHVQNVGWQSYVCDGELSGTSGQSLRLEGINIKLSNYVTGGITYQTHVQDIGWQSWKSNDQLSGTSGQSKRLEAIRIKLTGEAENNYDVYYSVHLQDFGWLGWAKNGEASGSEGYSKRLEGIKIVLVKKGGSAPGSTSNHFLKFGHEADDESEYTSISGSAKTSVAQMVRYFNANNGTYDKFSKYGTTYDGVLAKGGASTIEAFCQIFYEEAVAEGIRPEVAFCQSMKETSFLKYGGQVKPNQYNFAGIGATDGGAEGAKFDNVRMGIRAQIQHLKAYANKDSLKNTCVDPRFNLVTRGSAQYVEWLGKKENPNGYGWATAQNYGYDIVNMLNVLLSK